MDKVLQPERFCTDQSSVGASKAWIHCVFDVFQLGNKLELRCKNIDAESTSLTDFLKNWEEISPKILDSFDNKELLPDANLSSGMFVLTWYYSTNV